MLLDATTLLADNFSLMEVGAEAPTDIANVKYFPLDKTVRLYINPEQKIKDTSFIVTSSGVKTSEGDEASFCQTAYLSAEQKVKQNDTSIIGITYLKDGIPYVIQPQNGKCSICVRLVNSDSCDREVTLSYYLQNRYGSKTIAERHTVIVPSYGIINDSCELTAESGKVMGVSLLK